MSSKKANQNGFPPYLLSMRGAARMLNQQVKRTFPNNASIIQYGAILILAYWIETIQSHWMWLLMSSQHFFVRKRRPMDFLYIQDTKKSRYVNAMCKIDQPCF